MFSVYLFSFFLYKTRPNPRSRTGFMILYGSGKIIGVYLRHCSCWIQLWQWCWWMPSCPGSCSRIFIIILPVLYTVFYLFHIIQSGDYIHSFRTCREKGNRFFLVRKKYTDVFVGLKRIRGIIFLFGIRTVVRFLCCFFPIKICRAMDPDPHSFSLLNPDPHSICGSGSRRGKFEEKTFF